MNNNQFTTNNDNMYNLKFLEKISNDNPRVLRQRNLQIIDNQVEPIDPNRPGFSVLELHNKLNDTIDDYGVAVYHPSIKSYGAILSYPDEVDQEDSLHISNKTSRMEVGDYFFCMCMFLPYTMKRSTNKVIWEVDNTQVAEIVEHNVLLCKTTGTATVTVRSIANPELTDSFTFEVVEAPTMEYPTKVNVDLAALGITPGEVSDEVAITNFQKMKEWLEGYKDDVPREIIFPKNTLIQVLLTYGQGDYQSFENIYLPSYCDINLNGSTIKVKKNNLLSYILFRFGDTVSPAASAQPKDKPNGVECKWTRMRDGTITGEYGEKGSNAEIGYHEAIMAFMFDYSERCGIQNMTIEKFPGFTIVSMKGLHSRAITLNPKNFVNGALDPKTGEQVYSNSSVVCNDFIDITFYKLRNQFDISSPYGYGGYLTGTRNFTVCFYDENKAFVSSLVAARMCVNQEIPKNAKYVKIEFYCKSMPEAAGNAMYIKDRYEPYRDYIIGCTLQGNKSCAFAPAGGSHFRIYNNIFQNNGRQTPACDADYEDGWQLQGYNDVWKGNTMHKHIILCAGKGFIFVENTFVNQGHFWVYAGTDSCAIIRNTMKDNPSGSKFDVGVLGVFSGNDCANMSITCEGKYRTDPFVIENNIRGANTVITADKPIEDDATFSDGTTIRNCYYRNCTITCDHLNIEGGCTFENVHFKMKYDKDMQLAYESVMILFKNCTFECRLDTVPEGQTPYCKFYGIGGASCYYKNCVFKHNYYIRDGAGWQKVNMTFDKCEFNGDGMARRTVESNAGHFLFKNCTFNQYRFKMSSDRIAGGMLEFVNCKYIEKPGEPDFFIPDGDCRKESPTFIKLTNSPSLMENYEVAMGNNRIVIYDDDSLVMPEVPIQGFDIVPFNVYKDKVSTVVKPKLIPENATQKEFTISSSKPDIVEVRGKQLFGKAIGQSEITITSTANETITKTVTVTVVENDKVGDYTTLNLVTELDASGIDQANNLWKDNLAHNDFNLAGFTYDGVTDGVVNGGVKFTKGRRAKSVNNFKLLAKPFTMECIVEFNDVMKERTQWFMSTNLMSGMLVGIYLTRGFALHSVVGSYDSDIIPEVGRKYHLCVTVQTNLVRFYVDGVLLHTSNNSNRANDATPMFVGGISTTNETLEGIMYKFRFYDRGLTPDEVHRNYIGVGDAPAAPEEHGNIVLASENINIDEGAQTTVGVTLDKAPTNTQTVTIASDSSWLNVTEKSLIFTKDNYNISQNVTIDVPADSIPQDSVGHVTFSSEGVTDKTLTVNAKNVELVPPTMEVDVPNKENLVCFLDARTGVKGKWIDQTASAISVNFPEGCFDDGTCEFRNGGLYFNKPSENRPYITNPVKGSNSFHVEIYGKYTGSEYPVGLMGTATNDNKAKCMDYGIASATEWALTPHATAKNAKGIGAPVNERFCFAIDGIVDDNNMGNTIFQICSNGVGKDLFWNRTSTEEYSKLNCNNIIIGGNKTETCDDTGSLCINGKGNLVIYKILIYSGNLNSTKVKQNWDHELTIQRG